MVDIGTFVKKRRKTVNIETVVYNKAERIPWYKRPLYKEEFTYRTGKNDKIYVRHNDWHNTIWIGPYDTEKDANAIIDSYIEESQKEPLDRKYKTNIHSVKIEDSNAFFKKA